LVAKDNTPFSKGFGMTWLRTSGLRLLLAIGLGFSLWVFVSYTTNPDRLTQFKDLPVDPEELAAGLVIVDQNGLPNPPLPPVTITLRSIGDTTVTPSSNDIEAYVDLTGQQPGERSVPVRARITTPGRKPEIAEIKPDLLAIRIEQVLTRTVPLTIEVVGNVPFSYQDLPPRATVSGQAVTEISISGPRSQVERVATARATANIDRLTANYDAPRQLEAIDADKQVVEGVVIRPERVNISVPIVSIAGIKRVPIIPSITGEPASGYVVAGLSVAPQFVRLAGGSGSLENVQSITTEPVNIAGASGTITRVVELQGPLETPLLSGEPVSATVTVRIQPIARPFQVTLPVPVQLIDIGPGLLGSVNPLIVQVTLAGTAAQLNALDSTALAGTVSAAGLGAGIYSVAPAFTLPRGVELVGDAPKVTLVLRLPASPTPQPTPTATATDQPSEAPPTETPPEPIATPAAEPNATPRPAEEPSPTPAV
jgi:YbbR domain-containing protein